MQHILTVAVEDYYHTAALRRAVQPKHWERLELRLDKTLAEVLDLLDSFGAKATFFVFGWIADQNPEFVRMIVARGHEVASRGYSPRARARDDLTREEFLEDLHRAKSALEAAGANRIIGYRAPEWLRTQDRWILDVLAEEGYVYDSSVNPVLRRFADEPEMFRIHRHVHADGARGLMEFPISTASVGGLRVALTGGNYIRQLPHTILSRVVAQRSTSGGEPLVFYFMPWELDKHQPRIQGVGRLQHIRQYRNLAKTRWVLKDYMRRYEFQGIADYLGVPLEAGAAPSARPAVVTGPSEADRAARAELPEVTLVVPMYNEALVVKYLRRTLVDFRRQLEAQYRVRLLLVDDGSSDDTWALVRAAFADVPDCDLLQHAKNEGVAAAILTGIRAAKTEIVCSIDSDCSYDPRELHAMIPKIEHADMVTASPYHPEGHVLNVPTWRLFLSKTLTKLYSAVLHQRFYTLTSCCRVYRKSAVADLEIENGGFLGVAETLIALRKRGGRIVEHPATLEARLLGESKMKVAKTIMSHLHLLEDLALHGHGRGGGVVKEASSAASSPRAQA